MEIIINTHGTHINKKQNRILIKAGEEVRSISIFDITAISITKPCTISSEAIQLAARHKIAISFIDATGKVQSKLWGTGYGSIATVRRKQILFAQNNKFIEWVVEQLIKKTQNQKQVLKTYAPKTYETFDTKTDALWYKINQQKLPVTPNEIENFLNQIRGIEGVIGNWYWGNLRKTVKPEIKIGLRRQRPATDAFNALLNYYYGMLYNYIETSIITLGLDPYLAFLHTDQYQEPTLAFDLIEQFRGWADGLVIQLFTKQTVKPQIDFDVLNSKYYYLNTTGKKKLIPKFNKMLSQTEKLSKQQIMRKNLIKREINELKKRINQTVQL